MKKIKVFVISAFFVLSFTYPVYSLQILGDDVLRQVSAKGSVEIEIDNMKIDAMPGTMIYTDDDGSGNGVSASVHVIGDRTVQTFAAITDETDREGLLAGSYGDIALLGDHAIDSSEASRNLTISIVDELPLLSAINRFNRTDSVSRGRSAVKDRGASDASASGTTVSGILVNLPTLEMNSTGGTHQLVFKQEGAVNNEKFYFYHEISGIRTTAILGGKVEIAAR